MGTYMVDVAREYFKFRHLVQPSAGQALLFLVSEVGELADAHVNLDADWVRNSPEKERSIEDEIGDIMLMLTVYADTQGLDPVECMEQKMRKKGFEI